MGEQVSTCGQSPPRLQQQKVRGDAAAVVAGWGRGRGVLQFTLREGLQMKGGHRGPAPCAQYMLSVNHLTSIIRGV